MKLVECVPNVSEGRDRGILDALGGAVSSVEGVRLLDVDAGAATNRTVFTFVGAIDAVEAAAFLLAQEAVRLIDMRAHRGAHPRLGALDVCPFVPLGETTMAECVALARRVGRRIGEDLGIPVYLYEEAAARPDRRSLAAIRKGEYEGLEAKLADAAWAPDFGPARFAERSGAIVVGAREFLIAYNVNLNTRSRRHATIIAQNIRETGRPKRDTGGSIVKDAAGATITEPGPSMLAAVRATGWYIEDYGQAQVSINLLNFRVTPPHAAFEAVEREAARLGLRVTGSEVVGLIPREAVLAAGRHYLEKQGRSPAVHEAEIVRTAVISLGLRDVAPFDPARKIVEYAVAEPPPLAGRTVADFLDSVASPSPTPGGGSVAALCAALSAALSAMVGAATYERDGFEEKRERLGRLGERAQQVRARMSAAVDDDARAFDRVLAAGRLPRRTAAERRVRDEGMLAATLGAIEVPLAVMRDGVVCLEIADAMAREGMPSAISDAGVAALAAGAAVEGAWYNVRINLATLSEPSHGEALRQEADGLRARAEAIQRDVARRVSDSFGA